MDEKSDTESELIIGGYDEEIDSDYDLQYFPVVSPFYWAISMKSARYNKKDLFNNSRDIRIALIDTGTSLIHMPTSDFKTFNSTIYEKNNNQCIELGLIFCSCTES